MELQDSVAIVTGASRGIGRALCLALVRAGSRVFGCARDAERLAALAREAGEACVVQSVDCSNPAAGQRMVEIVVERFGRLDLLVNNAACINWPGTIEELPVDEWRRVFDLNVIGLVAILRAALPHLERSGGAAVNLSSDWGRFGAARFGPYCASKFAVEGLSQAAAAEADRATVVALSPGIVATDMLDIAFDGSTGGAPEPAECAERFVAFLRELGPSMSGRPQRL